MKKGGYILKKRIHFPLLFAVFLCFLIFIPNAFALYVGQQIKFQYGLGTSVTGGGEFTVTDTSGNSLFRTFCIETNEHVDNRNTFVVGDISKAARHGGSGGGDPDLLDIRTAYLFYHFTKGTLEGYGGSQQDQVDLQKAIWFIEGEVLGKDNRFVEIANDSTWTDIGSVRVINLEYLGGGDAQDQLVLVSEPATLLLSGLGLLFTGVFFRRKFIK